MPRSANKHGRAYMERKMRIATAAAKRAGYSSFKAGSAGAHKREEIAMAMEREHSVPKRKKR